MKKRIFSGIQPTGTIHIGNYLGAIKNWVPLQDNYDCVWSIVDLHALTAPEATKNMQAKVFDLATTFMAAGLDPKKATILVQSYVPEHAELTWYLNTITPIAELERMTQFKDKSKNFKQNINMGLFDYPVLMAADILIYKAEVVPVGEDQVQHVELARKIARKFNNQFGRTFPEPEAKLNKFTARIKSLADPNGKMAKSVPNSFVSLTDSPKEIENKIMRAVTDSGSDIKHTPDKPAIANLMDIYQGFSNMAYDMIEQKFKGKGYGEFKKDLAQLVVKSLKPIQEKKKKLEQNPAKVWKLLQDHAKKIRPIAQATLQEVKRKMELI